MKLNLCLITVICFFTSLLNANCLTEGYVIHKAGGGPEGWRDIRTEKVGSITHKYCDNPGTLSCSAPVAVNPIWAPNDSYGVLESYANDQISNNFLNGNYDSNVYYNNQLVYRNVTWSTNITSGVTTITITLSTI